MWIVWSAHGWPSDRRRFPCSLTRNCAPVLSKLVDDALFLFAAAVLPKPTRNQPRHLVTVRSTHPLKINTIESTTNHACHHIPPPPPPIARPPRTSTLRRPSAPPSVTVRLSLPSHGEQTRESWPGCSARWCWRWPGRAWDVCPCER
ncbi:hypothetical protein K456DRAFT_1096517 [Colletotrichum gloeosporioides 23]|nr:hypothetical protein K456DRAFT_1096517 [Colletotrichum gloeosporioides 23]